MVWLEGISGCTVHAHTLQLMQQISAIWQHVISYDSYFMACCWQPDAQCLCCSSLPCATTMDAAAIFPQPAVHTSVARQTSKWSRSLKEEYPPIECAASRSAALQAGPDQGLLPAIRTKAPAAMAGKVSVGHLFACSCLLLDAELRLWSTTSWSLWWLMPGLHSLCPSHDLTDKWGQLGGDGCIALYAGMPSAAAWELPDNIWQLKVHHIRQTCCLCCCEGSLVVDVIDRPVVGRHQVGYLVAI